MKKILMSILLLVLVVVSPFAAFAGYGIAADELDTSDDFDLTLTSVNPIISDNGQTENIRFRITGQMVDDNVIVDFVTEDPADFNNNMLEVRSVLIQRTISNNEIADLSLDVYVPENAPAGNYNGIIKVVDTENQDNYEEVSYTIKLPSPSFQLKESDGLSDLNILVISGPEESEMKNSFKIKNTGNVPLNDLKFNFNGDFSSGEDVIQLKYGNLNINTDGTSPLSLPNINDGSDATIEITAIVPSGMDEGAYDAKVTVFSTIYNLESTFDFEVRVEPETCKDGRVSDSQPVNDRRSGRMKILDLDVDDDSLEIGETIEATVEVETEDDFDVVNPLSC